MKYSTAMGLVATVCAFAAQADVVTNSETFVVNEPTVLEGVTNINKNTTLPAVINADLTLDKKTYLRFMGANTTGTSTGPTDTNPQLYIATNANDVTITIKGNSTMPTTYRNSGQDSASSAWMKTGIDPAGTKSAAPSMIRVQLGVPNGPANSTGSAFIDIQTPATSSQGWGSNLFGGFWAEWLYINTSVTPNADGYVDFLRIENNCVADIAYIENRNAAPARILFNGGTLLRNNALAHGAPLSPAAGHELVCWGVDGASILLKKQFNKENFTGRKGTVRFVGKDIYLVSSGNHPAWVSDNNFHPWCLSSADNVIWEQTGDIYLKENQWLRTETDDVLPHGAANGGIIIMANTGISFSKVYDSCDQPYCYLDLYGTSQRANSVTSYYSADNNKADYIGVVTNSLAGTKTGYLRLGERDQDCRLMADCRADVEVVKDGAGTLVVRHTRGEKLTVEAGTAEFQGTTILTNVSCAAGAHLTGDVTVLGSLSVSGTGKVNFDGLNLALGADAKIVLPDGVTLTLFTLKVNGAIVTAGNYAAADTPWLESGSVAVLMDPSVSRTDLNWTAGGASTSASLADNWNATPNFSIVNQRPVFATVGSAALFDCGLAYLNGLRFDAPGDFTVTADSAADTIKLFDQVELGAVPADGSTRTYTVDAPIALRTSLSVAVPTNVTLKLRDVTGQGGMSFEMKGLKFRDDWKYAYTEGGTLEVENLRVPGKITHKLGGGWFVLKGDVGCPGDTANLDLDYIRYYDDKSAANGLMNGGLTRFSGATVWKPVSVNGQGQVGGQGSTWCKFTASTTNTFKELVTCAPSTAFVGEQDTMIVFEKGVHVTGGSFNPNSSSSSRPATYIFNGPVQDDSTSRQIQGSSNSRLVFNAAGNYSKLFVQVTSTTLELNAEDAFNNTGFIFDNQDGKILIGTTHQKAAWIISGKQDNWVATNTSKTKRGTIVGEYPSVWEIIRGAPDEAATSVTNSGVQMTGWVTLAKSGSGAHLMLNRAYESYGDVEVSGGILAFENGATWRNGTNVTVKGTGTLKLGKGETFGRQARLAVADSGVIDIPTGETLAVKTATVNGTEVDPGTYTAESGLFKDIITGGGSIRVRGVGALLIVR